MKEKEVKAVAVASGGGETKAAATVGVEAKMNGGDSWDPKADVSKMSMPE